jgi:hypothetical protein
MLKLPVQKVIFRARRLRDNLVSPLLIFVFLRVAVMQKLPVQKHKLPVQKQKLPVQKVIKVISRAHR